MCIFFCALCISAPFKGQFFAEIKRFMRSKRWKTCLVRHNIKPGIVHTQALQGLCFRKRFRHQKS